MGQAPAQRRCWGSPSCLVVLLLRGVQALFTVHASEREQQSQQLVGIAIRTTCGRTTEHCTVHGAVQGDDTDLIGSEAECDTDDDLAHAPRARNNAVHVRILLHRDHEIKPMSAVLGPRPFVSTARAVWLHVMSDS
jgi:hypothetical protein